MTARAAEAREASALARLWLAEPDHGGDAAAEEYHRLLLDGVPPYASAYLDSDSFVSWSHEARDWWPESWQPPEWVRAAASDHLGVSLQALGAWSVRASPAALHLASWAPVATAALRSYEPRRPFADLADRTDRLVLAAVSDGGAAVGAADERVAGSFRASAWPAPPDTDPDEEIGLKAVVSWLAVPRRAGWCLTVPDIARVASALELTAPGKSGRRDALATLFHTAGRDGVIDDLLGALDTEAARAQAHYGALATAWPAWTAFGREWAAQAALTRGFLARLGRATVDGAPAMTDAAHRP